MLPLILYPGSAAEFTKQFALATIWVMPLDKAWAKLVNGGHLLAGDDSCLSSLSYFYFGYWSLGLRNGLIWAKNMVYKTLILKEIISRRLNISLRLVFLPMDDSDSRWWWYPIVAHLILLFAQLITSFENPIK